MTTATTTIIATVQLQIFDTERLVYAHQVIVNRMKLCELDHL